MYGSCGVVERSPVDRACAYPTCEAMTTLAHGCSYHRPSRFFGQWGGKFTLKLQLTKKYGNKQGILPRPNSSTTNNRTSVSSLISEHRWAAAH